MLARSIVLISTAATLILPTVVHANDQPADPFEAYAECMERNDLEAIKDLLWVHKNVERIDASIYGLPIDDFDDQSNLTISERLWIREEKASAGIQLATSGPVQYPHHLRTALDRMYRLTGERPDCSAILDGVEQPGDPTENLDSGWPTDLNLTPSDSADRGEVDVVIDYTNPSRVMVSAVSVGGAASSNFISHTEDWGQSWTNTAVGNNSGSTWECDPVSYYQRSTGDVYHSKIACNNGWCSNWTRVLFRKSTNNGQSWSDCSDRPGAGNSEDRQWHVVDNTTSSACYGNIYVTWHDSNRQKVARSTDDCATFSSETNLTGIYQAITPDINVAADGHAYVVWQNYGDGTFKIAGSDDCGASWTSPSPKTVKTRLGDWKNNIPAQCVRGISTLPTVDVDRSPNSDFYGRVYMAMFDFNQSGCGSGPGCSNWTSNCNYDVWFTYSDNEGGTWSTPVNLTAADGNRVDNFMGYMRVDEIDGSIYIGYHRSRLNPQALADRQKTHFFVIRSIDGGQTWQEFQASSLEGDERRSGASSFERGDYNRVDVHGGVVWPVWVDRRDTTGEEEVVVRKLCSEPSHWSERSPTFTAPQTSATPLDEREIQISWSVPDLYWGDAGEDPSARKFQLWVDGALAEDDIPATAETTVWTAAECTTEHSFVVRAINQCGIVKDYLAATAIATGCCDTYPTVDVTPDGPMTVCTGTPIQLNADASGGAAPLSYQWYRDGAAISGAQSTLYNALENGNHSFNCAGISDGCTDGAFDPIPTEVTWQSEPLFPGADSAADAHQPVCSIDLSWNQATAVCSGPVIFNVYRSTSAGFTPGPENLVATELAGTSHRDDLNLVYGTTYHYIVRSVDSSNGAEDGNTITVAAGPSGPGGGSCITVGPIFSDGFDAGDVSSWSATGP